MLMDMGKHCHNVYSSIQGAMDVRLNAHPMENQCRHLYKLETEKDIQIGCKTFPLMLIKWKHKKEDAL